MSAGEPPSSRGSRKWIAITLAVVYLTFSGLVGLWMSPLDYKTLAGIALLPGILAALAAIPKVMSSHPRGLMALVHLVLYPLAVIVTAGFPGVLLALLVAEQFA